MRRRFGAILTGPGCAVAASGTMCEVVGEMSPSEVCATGTGIGAARALILWPELVTLGERCSSMAVVAVAADHRRHNRFGDVGDCRVGALPRPAAESGFFWVVLGIAALVSVGGNVLHA